MKVYNKTTIYLCNLEQHPWLMAVINETFLNTQYPSKQPAICDVSGDIRAGIIYFKSWKKQLRILGCLPKQEHVLTLLFLHPLYKKNLVHRFQSLMQKYPEKYPLMNAK